MERFAPLDGLQVPVPADSSPRAPRSILTNKKQALENCKMSMSSLGDDWEFCRISASDAAHYSSVSKLIRTYSRPKRAPLATEAIRLRSLRFLLCH
jgi:hypothetical protein